MGSANFSVRGLYVQSNNIFVFDDPATATLYEQAFQQSWDDPHSFASSSLAAGWHDAGGHDGLPSYSVCLSPHHDPDVSLKRVTDAITNAKSSVLFAIMEIGAGGGQLLDAIKALPSRPELYAFGTTQRLDGSLHVEKSGDPADGTFIPFSYLSKYVPAPFKEEWSGGAGQFITSSSSPTSTERLRSPSAAPRTSPREARSKTATTSSAAPTATSRPSTQSRRSSSSTTTASAP